MNFLRGVMGGQSAGPQHTEAETVRERRVWDLGRVRAGTETEDSGVRRSPPAPHRGSTCCLPLCLPFSPETSGLLLPMSLAQSPPRRLGPADCSRVPKLRRPGEEGGPWMVPPGKGSIQGRGGLTSLPRPSRPQASPSFPFPLAERNLKSCSLSRVLEWGFGEDWV